MKFNQLHVNTEYTVRLFKSFTFNVIVVDVENRYAPCGTKYRVNVKGQYIKAIATNSAGTKYERFVRLHDIIEATA